MAALRYTLLQFTNKVLNALDLQAVSTIGETEDSEQVIAIIDRAYAELDLNINWYPRRSVVRLDTSTGTAYNALTDNWKDEYPALPWTMKIPIGVESVYKIFYNDKEITYIAPTDFLERIRAGSANKTDAMPVYWTSGLMDEDYIYFDGYDSAIESYLVSSKSYAVVSKYNTTQLAADTDAISFPEKFYPAFINLCISYGFYEITGDTYKGDRYRKFYDRAKTSLNTNNKKMRFHNLSPSKVSFSRKRNSSSSTYIDDSKYNVVE